MTDKSRLVLPGQPDPHQTGPVDTEARQRLDEHANAHNELLEHHNAMVSKMNEIIPLIESRLVQLAEAVNAQSTLITELARRAGMQVDIGEATPDMPDADSEAE